MQSERIDIVITDMIMPQMNGKEVFKKIREINPDCPVIISSGLPKEQEMKEMQGLGLAGFVQKPFRQNELISVIESILL